MYNPLNYVLLPEVLKSFGYTPSMCKYHDTYESVEFPVGSTPPSKEDFEAKLQELIDAQPWKELREERNRRLAQCDWVAIRATTTEKNVPEEWKTYMQALRDLPANTTDPENPVWPQAPTP